jgi:hypothetical protein
LVAERFCRALGVALPDRATSHSASEADPAKHTERLKQPQDDNNHDHYVEDILDFAIHRQVIVDEVKNDANDGENDNQIDE